MPYRKVVVSAASGGQEQDEAGSQKDEFLIE